MFLLAIVVLSWGLSWYAIALQVGDVSPLASIAWRFGIAGVVLGAYLAIRGQLEWPTQRSSARTVLLGVCLFCLNFICFYHATAYVASGLISIVFAMAVFMNAANQWLWRREVPERRVLIGSVLGVIGIGLVFAPAIFSSSEVGGETMVAGLALSVLGTWFFSVGNLLSASLSRDTHLPSTIVSAMLIGAAVCTVLAFIRGESLALPMDPIYLSALIYLAIGASVIAFVAYLTLVAQVGASRAGYATILFPLVALSVSTLFEGYQWSGFAIAGVVFALSGAAVVFVRRTT